MKCQGGCVSLFSSERVSFPPPSDESDLFYEGGALLSSGADGTTREEEGVPCEGDAAKTSEDGLGDLPF